MPCITTLSGASAAVQAIARAWKVEPEAAAGAAPGSGGRRARARVIEPVSLGVRGTVAVGSYTVIELDGDVEVGPPGTFAMVRDPHGAAFLPRPVGLFRRPTARRAFLVDPAYSVGALAHARAIEVLSPLGSGFDLDGARAVDAAGRRRLRRDGALRRARGARCARCGSCAGSARRRRRRCSS